MVKTLHMMVGLPRSGKSTKARELGYPIVEPDAIRMVLHGTAWRPNVEPLVWAQARLMVEALFEAGHTDVILDATNHTAEWRKQWESDQWALRYHPVLTDIATCIQRARETGQEYLIPVIERMERDFEPLGGKLDC
jgi:predicted kinase